MKDHRLIAIIFLGLVAACEVATKQTVGTMTPAELSEKIAVNEDIVIFDVRTQEEIGEGVIHSQVLNIDFRKPDFDDRLSELDKTRTYAVYCMSGGRSSKTVDKMKEMGFVSIFNVEGGITAWEDAGLPISDKK